MSSLSQQPRGPVRSAVAVTTLALVSLALSAGAASAAPASATAPEHLPEHLPEHTARTLCTQVEEFLGRLPLPSGPVRVCKLVNGWD
ncbi:hypothetical protein PUR28_32180 [Streptomyces sp. BE308]|uniref:hypothetical protein n=1 Tax=Streptomyces sp. BE308 TaxID=3002529 RepID=UPI002E781F0E|nr:hypothetical protein [Streptomyces sp. BE308]MEE1795383.1 hypothetical protein [Streptomyces sp. BE308]